MNNDQDVFVFDETNTKKILRKAKLMSMLKVVGLTVLITPIIFVVIVYSLRQISMHAGQNGQDELMVYNDISAPNIHISNQTYTMTLFGGQIKTQTYKVIGDRPYIWEPIEGSYNLFGQYTNDYGAYSPIMLEGSTSLQESNQLPRYNTYTGDREMVFYHPRITYDTTKDAIQQLDELDNTLYAELALSFDKAYTLGEVKSNLPLSVRTVWYWVDTFEDDMITYFQQGQSTISANVYYTYGFHANSSRPVARQVIDGGPDELDKFISNVVQLRQSKSFSREANIIYDTLAGSAAKLEKEDVKIIGTIVTGTVEQLKVLQQQPYIKASTFGVITDFH